MSGISTSMQFKIITLQFNSLLKEFDDTELPYWHEVRPGATNTSVGAAEVISSIFRNMPNDSCYGSTKRFIRGDSGYCNVDVFNACRVANALFVTRMRENMLEPRIDSISAEFPLNVPPNFLASCTS